MSGLLYIQKQKFSAGVLVHIKIKNLGSESKVIRSFPDFFVIQNGKNGQNFHFEVGKVIQNAKNSQNFHFEGRKVIQNGKNSQNFHFEVRKVIQNGKNGQNFHFEIKV